jgi:hypothetical protein
MVTDPNGLLVDVVQLIRRRPAAAGREIYLNDPGEVAPEAFLTEVWLPIA